MSKDWITEHPNFKHIIKNRLMTGKTKNCLVVKNDKGEFLRPDYSPKHIGKKLVYSPLISMAFIYCGSRSADSYTVFDDAKAANGRVFVMTKAGDIEIFEKDFKYESSGI